jgi:hypothetical protein
LKIVDPPSGWLYGFPAAWDETQPLEEFLRSKGLPENLIKLGHVRIWEKNEDHLP